MSAALAFLAQHDIDGPWLNEQLVGCGVAAPGATVNNLTAELIGTGQVGENVRCHLDWEGEGPATVVVKLPSSSEMSRAAAAATRTYIREVGFYRDVHHQLAITTPVPYHVSEDRAANRFILVMADITPAVQGDQLRGCTPAQAVLAVEAIVGLHGPTWDRDDLATLDWVDESTPTSRADRVALIEQLFGGFIDRYRPELSADELDAGHWLRGNLAALLAAPTGPRCLVHGDFRLDNLLFGTGPGAAPLTTVDWQTVSYGHGLTDVAYFLSAGLSTSDRRVEEDDLLARYRRGMASHGIGLEPEAIKTGYALGSASGYLMAVIASQIVERTERGDTMFLTMARGAAQLMYDVDLAALVTG